MSGCTLGKTMTCLDGVVGTVTCVEDVTRTGCFAAAGAISFSAIASCLQASVTASVIDPAMPMTILEGVAMGGDGVAPGGSDLRLLVA